MTVRPWADRVRIATPVDPHAPVTLVRPDGYIAWAAEDLRHEAVTEALADHCGTPPRA